MALEWEILVDANCVVVTWRGAFDLDEYMTFYEQLAEHPDFQPTISRIYDMRGTRYGMSPAELSTVSARLQQQEPRHSKRKVAFIVGDDLTFGVLRQFVVSAASLQADYTVVRDPKAAKAWVGLDPDHTLPFDRDPER